MRRCPTITGVAAAVALVAQVAIAAADDLRRDGAASVGAPAVDQPLAATPTGSEPDTGQAAEGAPATGEPAAGPTPLPIEVEALDGIEWRRNENLAIARGSVRAVRGDTTVFADELAAHYRTNAAGETEVWQLDGRGHVRIIRPDEQAFGDAGVYDLDTEHLVLTGAERPRVVTTDSEISGKNRVEYFVRERRLLAIGDAIAVDKEKTVRGDTITAYLTSDPAAGSSLDHLDAAGKVSVVTGQDTYRGDRLDYNAKTDIATLTGSVTITQGQSKMDGCRGVSNLKTGVSTLYGCDAAGTARKPARGLIVPGGDGKS